jgi:hypothetical protein
MDRELRNMLEESDMQTYTIQIGDLRRWIDQARQEGFKAGCKPDTKFNMTDEEIIDKFTAHCLICAINTTQNNARFNLVRGNTNDIRIEQTWFEETVKEWDALQLVKAQLYKILEGSEDATD